MIDLLQLLNDNSKSLTADMKAWFEQFPAGAAWNVYSDYCVLDPNKANDSFSFVITLHHDTDTNFSEYISNVAPKDIKKTRQASGGLISYLNCPIAFSVSFLVERQSNLLRQFITDANMLDFVGAMRELVCTWLDEPQAPKEYWTRIDKALVEFATDIQRKKFNSKLARQVLITSTFAAFLFAKITELKQPSYIRWITDRDSSFEKYNEVAFDLGFILFQLLRLTRNLPFNSNKPQFLFAYPFIDGKTPYAEHIRLPDYLAGLCADIKVPDIEFTHAKFHKIFGQAIINSRNNVLIEVLGDQEKVTTRRLFFSA